MVEKSSQKNQKAEWFNHEKSQSILTQLIVLNDWLLNVKAKV